MEQDTSIKIISLVDAAITAEMATSLRDAIRAGADIALLGGGQLAQTLTSSLPQTFAFGLKLPQAVAISAEYKAAIIEEAALSDATIAGAAIAEAVSTGAKIAAVDSALAEDLDAKTRSDLMKGAVAQIHIEAYFPEHPWATHKEESLAACYHTLAALFIRLNDLDAAHECLDLSSTYEDSPRALALKAILAKLEGQTLGAVANMVSSLQQYEQRKAKDTVHYLTFKPKNIEVINYRLKEGLEALNQRDNEGALTKFTEAVFTFDTFYSDMGLDKAH